MKKVYIVHGWDFNPNMNWYPWLKKELEKKGFKVIVPEMPNTSEPVIEEWISYLKKIVAKLDEDTYLIGHSIGCQTIMRYLEKEKFNGKLPKVIFIAGWFNLKNLEDEEVKNIAKPWMETSIDFNKVKERVNNLTVFLSTNEPYNYVKENSSIFKNKLNAKIVIIKKMGHFTEEDNVLEVPFVLEEILNK